MTDATLPPVRRFTTIDEVLAVLERGQHEPERSDRPIREGLNQLEHALQCGHNLREMEPNDVELHVAGLVHDIGHLLVPGDDAGHGRHAAEALCDIFGPRVARLVEMHVPAKRYLVVTEHSYVLGLSDVSLYTLVAQGGRMSDEECTAFAADPDSGAAIALRRADEAAKVLGRDVPSLDTWRPVLEQITRAIAA